MSDDASGPEGRPVALVTGASRGLGFLLARELAERGHDLVLCARSADGLNSARADLERHGVQVLGVPADIGMAAEATGVVDAALVRFGRLDVLVCNAGLIQVGPAAAMRADDDAQAMDVMFWGLVHPALAALPADSLPLLSMNAERAARKLVDATLRGRPEVVLTPAAKVGMRLHGLAPATTLRVLAGLNRLLPATVDPGPSPGHLTGPPPRWFTILTRRSGTAARRWHQFDDETAPMGASPRC
jgi:NAD(P)-dependent dehydrogenase (short-subunit alcohol dehydrogenase family)